VSTESQLSDHSQWVSGFIVTLCEWGTVRHWVRATHFHTLMSQTVIGCLDIFNLNAISRLESKVTSNSSSCQSTLSQHKQLIPGLVQGLTVKGACKTYPAPQIWLWIMSIVLGADVSSILMKMDTWNLLMKDIDNSYPLMGSPIFIIWITIISVSAYIVYCLAQHGLIL